MSYITEKQHEELKVEVRLALKRLDSLKSESNAIVVSLRRSRPGLVKRVWMNATSLGYHLREGVNLPHDEVAQAARRRTLTQVDALEREVLDALEADRI